MKSISTTNVFFLYQLVNLVLETCFIFLKCLKSRQDISLCLGIDHYLKSNQSLLDTMIKSMMVPFFQIISSSSQLFEKIFCWKRKRNFWSHWPSMDIRHTSDHWPCWGLTKVNYMASLFKVLSDFYFLWGVFMLHLQHPRWSSCWETWL